MNKEDIHFYSKQLSQHMIYKFFLGHGFSTKQINESKHTVIVRDECTSKVLTFLYNDFYCGSEIDPTYMCNLTSEWLSFMNEKFGEKFSTRTIKEFNDLIEPVNTSESIFATGLEK